MQGIERILAASDLSRHADHAAKRTAMIATALKCWTLELLTIIDEGLVKPFAQAIGQPPAAARCLLASRALRHLNETAEATYKRYPVRFFPAVRFGLAASELSARANEADIDLVIVGAHGTHFADEWLFGDTATKLMVQGTRPLLIVKAEPTTAYRSVLITIDFSADSLRAAHMAMQIAPDATLTFLHVVENPAARSAAANQITLVMGRTPGDPLERARHRLREFVAALGPLAREARQIVDTGLLARSMTQHAAAVRADLIATGKRGVQSIQECMPGSSIRQAAERAPCDLLVATCVRQPMFRQPPYSVRP